MNFDETYIAIRQRNLLEIVDLSLHVIRDHFFKLIPLLLLGAIPFFIINHLILGWMSDEFNYTDYLPRYVWMMLVLVAVESQIATAFISYYLGQAIFEGSPGVWKTVKSTFKSCTYFLTLQSLTRMVVPTVLVAALMCNAGVSDDFSLGWGITITTLLAGLGLVVRALRPFTAEVLLLERTPVRANPGVVHYSKRSNALHGNAASELFGRFFLVVIIAAPLSFMFYSVLMITDDLLNLHIDNSQSLVRYYWPIALWLTAGILAVVRFLSYIDIRIRQEGWAVELRVRAEALRLQNRLDEPLI